VYIKVC